MNNVGRFAKLCPACGQRRMTGVDVFNVEVQNRARVIKLGLLGLGKHQSHVSALKERQTRRCLEQEWETKGIAIERHGATKVLGADGDLADRSKREWSGHGGHQGVDCNYLGKLNTVVLKAERQSEAK